MSLNLPSIGGLPSLSVSSGDNGRWPNITLGAPETDDPTATEAPKPPAADLSQVPTTFTGPVDLPANDPEILVDVEEAQAPTVAEPIAAAGAPIDVYVAPMSTRRQRLWHKLLCIGCCIPDN